MIETQPTVLSLTNAAALKLHELTKEETNPNIGLRGTAPRPKSVDRNRRGGSCRAAR